jgi:tRNA threonylcarbamoyl adenosine modification protein (Sua5/YciO/YrdC/YwlC family)
LKTKIIQVDPDFPELDRIAQAVKVIRQGGLVVFPTETVYGIAADFSNEKAMARLREVKKRSPGKPFSMLVWQKLSIANLTTYSDPKLYKLIDRYWPGPLTVVVPAKEWDGTIGVRMPDHMIALSLVQESQRNIAAPSANFEGNPPPSSCEEALRDLDGLVDLAIDGGSAKLGIASSVVDFTQANPQILREGVIKQEDVDRIMKQKSILFVCTGNSCRSVMAEYLLNDKLKDRSDVEVASAGTGVFVRSTASLETINVLRQERIDASQHRSQPLNSILLKKADLILVMSKSHRQQILEWLPEVEKRVYLLREFANISKGFETDLDIPDPIGKPHADYEECLSMIKESIDKVAQLI